MRTCLAKSSGWTTSRRGETAGFTLIELLVTILVAAILAMLAAPSFREFIAAQRVKTASFDLMSMLTMARSEAIKRNTTATLGGLGSATPQITSEGTVLQDRGPLAGVTLTCKSGGTAVACTDVVYGGNGRLQASAPTIEIGSSATTKKTCIRIDPSGRPSSKQGEC